MGQKKAEPTAFAGSFHDRIPRWVKALVRLKWAKKLEPLQRCYCQCESYLKAVLWQRKLKWHYIKIDSMVTAFVPKLQTWKLRTMEVVAKQVFLAAWASFWSVVFLQTWRWGQTTAVSPLPEWGGLVLDMGCSVTAALQVRFSQQAGATLFEFEYDSNLPLPNVVSLFIILWVCAKMCSCQYILREI